MSNHIEYSNQSGKFTASELRTKVRESQTFWNSPEGKRKAAQLEIEKRNGKHVPAKFPELVGRGSAKATDSASVTHLKRRLNLIK